MKVLIQRVLHASVEVKEKIEGEIGPGLLIFLGVKEDDTLQQLTWLVNKLVNLRIFEDEQGKMNRSLKETGGSVLIISQFTLYGDCSEGRRPSFTQAAAPEIAKTVYDQFIILIRQEGIHVQTGVFGAEMKVSLINDGPVTFMIER